MFLHFFTFFIHSYIFCTCFCKTLKSFVFTGVVHFLLILTQFDKFSAFTSVFHFLQKHRLLSLNQNFPDFNKIWTIFNNFQHFTRVFTTENNESQNFMKFIKIKDSTPNYDILQKPETAVYSALYKFPNSACYSIFLQNLNYPRKINIFIK